MIDNILYVAPFALFGFMTFLIIRNYFRQKFDSNDERIDMKNDSKENN